MHNCTIESVLGSTTINIYRNGKYYGNIVIDSLKYSLMSEEDLDDMIKEHLTECGAGDKY